MIIDKIFTAFGWNVARISITGPESFPINYTADHTLHEEFTYPLVTKGVIKMDFSNCSIKDQNPHTNQLVAGDCPKTDTQFARYYIKSGESMLWTIDDFAEFWTCCEIANGFTLPTITIFRLDAGDSATIAGKKLFLCSGQLTANTISITEPTELDIVNSVDLTAISNCYGFFVDRERV